MKITKLSAAAVLGLAAMLSAGAANAAGAPSWGCPLAAPAGVTCINGGGSTASQNAYIGIPAGLFGGGELFQYATANPAIGFSYEGGQSTPAQQAVRDNTPSAFTGNTAETGYPVHFGASESYVNKSSPLASYVGPNHPLPGGGGQFIQIPMWTTVDVIPVANAKNTSNGAVKLTDDDLCGIFSGLLTNWNQTTAAAKMKPGLIHVYWRADNAGASASFLLTQHLAAVCNASNTKAGIVFTINSKFASLFPGVIAPPADGKTKWSIPVAGDGSFANFIAVTGSAGMADAVNNDVTVSAIGYVSPDYSSIAASPIPATAGKKSYTKLFVAALINQNDHLPYLPTTWNITLAVTNPGAASIISPPAMAANTAGTQTNWVPQIASPAKGYSIVGTSILFVPQCFSNPVIADALKAVITNNINGVYNNAIVKSGFVASQPGGAGKWGGAVYQTFVKNYYGLNLNINNPKACKGVTGR